MAWVSFMQPGSARPNAMAALLAIALLLLAAYDVLNGSFSMNAAPAELAFTEFPKVRSKWLSRSGLSGAFATEANLTQGVDHSEVQTLSLRTDSAEHPERGLQCDQQQNEVSARISQLAAQLPPTQLLPSPAAPFVFLHNRKCGGTTLRQVLWESAEALNSTALVSCFPPLHDCYRYNLAGIAPELLDAASIIAGHLSWDAVEDLGPHKNVSCFVILRDPIDMFASYFYHRHPLSVRDKRALSDLSPEELRGALNLKDEDAPWEWWELGGPGNSATRMLSGADITGHIVGTNAVDYVEQRRGIPLDLQVAQQHLSRCVVGLLGDMAATDKALGHWFPWLPKFAGFLYNVNEKRPRRESLRPGVRELITEYMSLDVALYESALQQFEQQKELLRMRERQAELADLCA